MNISGINVIYDTLHRLKLQDFLASLSYYSTRPIYSNSKMDVSNEYRMEINDEWLKYIINGRKTVEGRKNNPDSWGRLRVNDIILAVSPNNNTVYKFQITRITYYSTIREYLETEGLENCLPDVENIDRGIEIYMKWSTEEDVKKYGFMGIRIKSM